MTDVDDVALLMTIHNAIDRAVITNIVRGILVEASPQQLAVCREAMRALRAALEEDALNDQGDPQVQKHARVGLRHFEHWEFDLGLLLDKKALNN